MAPTLPIPTDNIYKFACLFGLTLIVVSIFSFVTMYTSSLDRKVKYMEVIIPLEAKSERSKAESEILGLNKKLIDVAKSNESTASNAIGVVLGIGTVISVFGAHQWHQKIQLRDDKMARLQIEKLEAEVSKLRIELTPSTSKSPDSSPPASESLSPR